MRNLIPTHVGTLKLQGTEDSQGNRAELAKINYDAVTDSLLCVFQPRSDGIVEIQQVLKNGTTEIFDQILTEKEHINVCDIKYMSDINSAVIVLEDGSFIVVSPDDENNSGEVEGHIDAASWSPDEEMLCIAARDTRSVIFASRDMDLLSEHFMSTDDLKRSKHVSVGWGKKETQFEGKGAKALRDPTLPTKIDTGEISPGDDEKMRISWRGDGQYVCISAVDSIDGIQRRSLRIFSRNDSLTAVSEPVDGLEAPIAWKPSGELIATARRIPDGNGQKEIVFFESNGLKRYSFPLRGSENSDVLDLAWNSNSEVLAVQLTDRVMLWTTKNYHWYLKQVIPGKDVKWMKWHSEKPYSIFLGYRDNMTVETHSFAWDIISGPNVGNDNGKTVVIDGEKMKITPFKQASVPPPMAFREIAWSETEGTAPVHCAFNESNVLCVLTGTEIIIYDDDSESSVAEKWTHSCPSVLQVAYLNERVTITTARRMIFQFDKTGHLLQEFSLSAYLIKPAVDYTKLVLENMAKKVFSLDHEPNSIGEFPERCTNIAVSKYDSIFGLSDTGRLYKGDSLIATSVTSFIATEDHIIFTTSQHFLKICHITDGSISVPGDDSKDDERCRDIERGSLLVSVVPSRNLIVLQAPRGNLETIYPRILVLTEVRNHINQLRYDSAFALCRVHRIDLNILYDYQPEQFEKNLKLFTSQLGKTDYLDLFISGLKNEDVSKTMYHETISGEVIIDEGKSPEKINNICDLLLPYISAQNRLTAYACMEPPKLETALKEVLGGSTAAERESSIQYLCIIQDIEKLYQTALAMYDLNLTLLIAQQSQKDPKEYLTFLREIKKQPQLRQHYTIDNHLKNYKKALEDLFKLKESKEAEEDELVSYVVFHELYSEGLSLSRYDESLHTSILRRYATYLYGKTNYTEAAMCFETLGDVENALDAYVIGGAWRQALSLAPKNKIPELSEHLIEILQEQHLYKDCGTIYLEYLEDEKRAVEMFCQGYAIHDAIRLAGKELLPVIDAKIIELYGTMTELAADCKQQVKSQMNRLRELRQKMQEDPVAFYGDGAGLNDVGDTVSLAGTESVNGSMFTRYTGKTGGTAQTGASRRTAKNKRREERKRARGKKGTVYEEEYLMKSLGRLVDRLNSTEADVKALLEGLYRRGFRDYSYQLQALFSEAVSDTIQILDEAFTVSDSNRERFDEDGEIYVLPEISKPLMTPFSKLTIIDY